MAEGHNVYVIRRLMMSNRVDQSQRNQLFRTICLVQGEKCSLIVDGGSQENIISSQAVSRFGLIPEAHPKPYGISWIKNVGELRVAQ